MKPHQLQPSGPELLTVTQAAEMLSVTPARIFQIVAAGRLGTRRLAGRVYLLTAEVLDEARRRRTAALRQVERYTRSLASTTDN